MNIFDKYSAEILVSKAEGNFCENFEIYDNAEEDFTLHYSDDSEDSTAADYNDMIDNNGNSKNESAKDWSKIMNKYPVVLLERIEVPQQALNSRSVERDENESLLSLKRLRKSQKKSNFEKDFYNCNNCQAKFRSNSQLTIHMKTHVRKRSYKCQVCYVKFSRKDFFSKHLKIHPESNINARQNNLAEKTYECDICFAEYLRKKDLDIHIKGHVEAQTPFKCNVCSAKFCKRDELKDHSRCHEKEKPYECDICLGRLKTKRSLRRHVKNHAFEKSFGCSES